VGELLSFFPGLALRHDPVTQTHGQCLLGADRPAGENQIERAAHADQARQAHRAAVH